VITSQMQTFTITCHLLDYDYEGTKSQCNRLWWRLHWKWSRL